MPKIKPSALISDIKGKSNGSVFSKNSGGIYFRNNPSGGGKKSAKWDLQKSRFSSLAQAWKSLTEEQQDAWNAIVPEYQTTNAFGDIRNPSGYEVFMRLNGSLSAINYPVLTVPLSPRSLPSTGVLTLEYPEQFQLNPVRWGTNFIPNTDFVRTIFWDSFFDDVPIMSDYTLAFRWQPQTTAVFPFMFSGKVMIYSALDDLTGCGYVLWIDFNNEGLYILKFECITPAVTGTFECRLTKQQILDGFHFGFVGDYQEMNRFRFFIDGVSTEFIPAILIGSTAGNFTASLEFFSDGGDMQFQAFISDFRYFTRKLEDDQMLLVSNGYVLDDETIMVTFTKSVEFTFPNESLIVPGGVFTIEDGESQYKPTVAKTSNLVPMFSLNTENAGIENTVINVFASAGVSTGRNGSYSNLKLISTSNWQEQTTLELWRQFRDVYKNIAANTQVRFEISVVDTQTGYQDKNRQAVPPKRPRFKAGSDLTDKVN